MATMGMMCMTVVLWPRIYPTAKVVTTMVAQVDFDYFEAMYGDKQAMDKHLSLVDTGATKSVSGVGWRGTPNDC